MGMNLWKKQGEKQEGARKKLGKNWERRENGTGKEFLKANEEVIVKELGRKREVNGMEFMEMEYERPVKEFME